MREILGTGSMEHFDESMELIKKLEDQDVALKKDIERFQSNAKFMLEPWESDTITDEHKNIKDEYIEKQKNLYLERIKDILNKASRYYGYMCDISEMDEEQLKEDAKLPKLNEIFKKEFCETVE